MEFSNNLGFRVWGWGFKEPLNPKPKNPTLSAKRFRVGRLKSRESMESVPISSILAATAFSKHTLHLGV